MLAAVLFWLSPLVLPQDEVRGLIEKLRSDKVEEREDAAKKLKELGRAAVPELEKAATSADAEVAAKAKDLLRVIAVMEQLTPALLKAMPGTEERLANGKPHAWTEAFLEAISKNKDGWPKYPVLKRKDLDPLAGPALEAAEGPEEKKRIGLVAADQGLRSAARGMIGLLKERGMQLHWDAAAWLVYMRAQEVIPDVLNLLESKNRDHRRVAVSLLGRLGSREVIPELLRRLNTEDDEVRIIAARELVGLGVNEALPGIVTLSRTVGGRCGWSATLGFKGMDGHDILPDLLKLLTHEHQGVRQAAVELIGALDLREAAPEVVKILDDSDEDLRAEAIRALGRLRSKEASPRIVRLLKDESSYIRQTSLGALAKLGGREATPEIVKMLQSVEVSDRREAAFALGVLQERQAIPALNKLLDAAESSVREAAAMALAVLGAKESIPQIARLLADSESGTRYSSAFALNMLEARDTAPRIVKLLEAKEPFVRHGAARVLCCMGCLEGARVLLKDKIYVTWVDAAREPKTWQRLKTLNAPTPIEGTAREILEHLAKEAELRLECPADPILNQWWMRISRDKTNLLEAADEAAGPYGVILEPDRIRIVPRDEAIEFWRGWLEAEERKRR